jgi:hypothetical protein
VANVPPDDSRENKNHKTWIQPFSGSLFFPKLSVSLRVLCGGPSAAMVPSPTAGRAQKRLLGRLFLCSAPCFLRMAVVVESSFLSTDGCGGGQTKARDLV